MRCRQEQLRCIYSAQRTLGRPRRTTQIRIKSEQTTHRCQETGLHRLPPSVADDQTLRNAFYLTFPGSDLLRNVDFRLADSSFVVSTTFLPGKTPSLPLQRHKVPSSSELHCGNACFQKIVHSLQHLSSPLPTNLKAAIRLARQASKTMHETMSCVDCGLAATNTGVASQNVVFFHVLFPLVSHAYAVVLKRVNVEASGAAIHHRQLLFDLADYGGIWGRSLQDATCIEKATRYKVAVDADTWRLMLRALLRADVYGLLDCLHPGLWDIVHGLKTVELGLGVGDFLHAALDTGSYSNIADVASQALTKLSIT